MKNLAELFKKKLKEHGPLSDKEAAARGSVYDDLEDMADEGIGKDIQSVKVMANDKKSLEAGLDKAKEIVKQDPQRLGLKDAIDAEPSEEKAEGMHDNMEEEMNEADDLSDEEIAHMEEMLAKAKAKRSSK